MRQWVSRALFGVGIALLSYCGSAALEAQAFQVQLERRLESSSPREARASGLVGRLEIPRLGVSAMVTEGVDEHALGLGIGHVPTTALPGEAGNVALAAHRDTYFRRLKDVARGDRVRLSTPDGVFAYEVEWTQVVDPDRVDLLDATAAPALTLVTCYPFHWIGSAPKRFVVRCRPVEDDTRPVPTTQVVAAAVPSKDVPIAPQVALPIDPGPDSLDSVLEAAEIR